MLASYVQSKRDEEGFTLIELLVVVIIIGILAAIAIPVFLNQRENAWRGTAESDARNAAIEVESYLTREGNYPTATITLTQGHENPDLSGVRVSENVTLVYAPDGSNAYTITASHSQVNEGASSVVYSSDDGGIGEWSNTGGAGNSP